MYTSQCEGAGDEVGVLGGSSGQNGGLCTYMEDPGMSLGSSRQHGGLRVRDNPGGSQYVLGIFGQLSVDGQPGTILGCPPRLEKMFRLIPGCLSSSPDPPKTGRVKLRTGLD